MNNTKKSTLTVVFILKKIKKTNAKNDLNYDSYFKCLHREIFVLRIFVTLQSQSTF